MIYVGVQQEYNEKCACGQKTKGKAEGKYQSDTKTKQENHEEQTRMEEKTQEHSG